MRVRIDPDRCFVCGLCAEVCPEMFAVGRLDVRANFERVLDGLEAECFEAAAQCPRGAIWMAEVPRWLVVSLA